MKLKDFFKKAINDGDWNKVCDVYTKITGERINPPLTAIGIADMEMDALPHKEESVPLEEQEMGNANDDEPIPPPRPRPAQSLKKKEGDLGKRSHKEEIEIPKKRVNKFVDNLTIAANELVTDKPHLGVANPRSRQAAEIAEPIDVICSLCKSKFSISPSLAHGWSDIEEDNVWKCNDCCTADGRAKALRKERQLNDSGKTGRRSR